MITVVLLKPQTSANIGFIARAMQNFDLSKLIIIEPLCDYKDEEALKTSSHAKDILEKARIKKYEYLSKLKQEFDLVIGSTSVLGTDYNIPRTPLLAEEFSNKISKENIAIVFGNEAHGLSNEEISKCDFIVTIPSSKKYPALNISHAATIIFYELYKKLGKNKLNNHITPITRKEKEVIMKKFENIINKLDFTTEQKKQTQIITWQKMFEKAMLSKRESFVILGLLKKLEEKN
jgi:TrmH family RNA methyltransferase